MSQQQLQNKNGSNHNFIPENEDINQAAYPTVNCIYHPSYYITNFCSDLRCLLPLCPQCVKVHIQEHRQKGTYGEIDTLDSIYDKTVNQVKLCQQYHRQKQEKIQILKNQKESILDDLEVKMAELKQRVFEKVEESFVSIKNELKNRANMLVQSQIDQLQKLQEKNFEKEKFFENYTEGLENSQKCLKFLIKFYNDGIYNSNQNDIRQIDRSYDAVQNNEVTLHINEEKIQSMFNILKTQVVHMTSRGEFIDKKQVIVNNVHQNIQMQQNNKYQQNQQSTPVKIISQQPVQGGQIFINGSPVKTSRPVSPSPISRSPVQIKTPVQISQVIQNGQNLQQSNIVIKTVNNNNVQQSQIRSQFQPSPLSIRQQLGISTMQNGNINNNNNLQKVQVPNSIIKRGNRSSSPQQVRQIAANSFGRQQSPGPIYHSQSQQSNNNRQAQSYNQSQQQLQQIQSTGKKQKIFSDKDLSPTNANNSKNINLNGNTTNTNKKKPDLVTQLKTAFEQSFIFNGNKDQQ